MSETTVTSDQPITVEEEETAPGFIGQNVPRKEDRRLVQGEGVFVDDVKRHGMAYVHFVRSPYAHAAISAIDVSKAMELEGVYGTLIGEEVAAETDPFFQIAPPPGGDLKDYALALDKTLVLLAWDVLPDEAALRLASLLDDERTLGTDSRLGHCEAALIASTMLT